MARWLAILLFIPVGLPAQATYAVAPFATLDRSLPGTPLLLGASGAAYVGNFGVRVSGSSALRDYQLTAPNTAFGDGTEGGMFAYAGDVELVVRPGRKAGAAGAFGPVDPRVFAGIGVRAERFAGAEWERHDVVTFGSTLSYSLLSRLRGEVEARRVVPLASVSGLLDGTAAGAWEYRAGLALHFGRGNLRPTGGILDALPIPGARAGPRRVVDVEPGTVLGTANQLVGIPYVWGGASRNGFDCSGFVQYVFAEHDVPLPRTSREMAQIGEDVSGTVSALKPGDLMFFAENKDGRITHVAIYGGSNMMIHSSKSGRGVGYDDLSTDRGRWFQDIYIGARRVLGVEIQAVVAQGGAAGAATTVGSAGVRHGAGIAAFLAAAGMSDLSDLARRLYAPDERPDGPDNAPARRW